MLCRIICFSAFDLHPDTVISKRQMRFQARMVHMAYQFEEFLYKELAWRFERLQGNGLVLPNDIVVFLWRKGSSSFGLVMLF